MVFNAFNGRNNLFDNEFIMKKLHVDSVIKNFGLKLVLSGVFISCEPNQIVGLLGRNGSGKSTLLKIILGSIRADNKFIIVNDKITNSLFDNRMLVNYLSQDNFLPSHIKLKTIIKLFCNEESSKLLSENELIKPLLDKKTKELSGGERRFFEVLLIAYSQAKYVLIDEPFNGVAPLYKSIIKKSISEQSKNKGFIITDHDYKNIIEISDKIFVLKDGNTKEINEISQLVNYGYLPKN